MTGVAGRGAPGTPRRDLRADLDRCGAKPFLREASAYAVLVYRFGQWTDLQDGTRGRMLRLAYWAAHRLVISLTNIELPKEATVGPGLRIHHSGPVVVHPLVVIGKNCTLRHGVTLGERAQNRGVPRLGDNVEIGAYAQVLGPVLVGDGAKIGAMALVLDDVPSGGTAVAPRAEIRSRR